MKFLIKFLIVQITCVSLLVTDSLARQVVGDREAGQGKGRRPYQGSSGINRSPFTGSKMGPSSERIPPRPTVSPQPPRPSQRPTSRPEFKPTARPDKPPADRPQASRPTTRPGNVSYPKPRPPAAGSVRPGDRTDRPAIHGDTRPDARGTRAVPRPGKNTRPVQRPDFNRPSSPGKRPGDDGSWWNAGGKRSGYGDHKDANLSINRNFQNHLNWSTNRKHWGPDPWWNRSAIRPWYGGTWNGGWNPQYHHRFDHYRPRYYRGYPGYIVYHDDGISDAIGWGLLAWGLGNLVYSSGYCLYSNPYPAPPVYYPGGVVNYHEPVTVVATNTAPDNDEAVAAATARSESWVTNSQAAFKQRNYLVALEAINKAIAEAPGDGALHEYRALIFFALGKYSEAAGVLHPVLASGPGWDWSTMITLYDSQETYTAQLKALERYTRSKPEAADSHFLLGYHYMICGHPESAAGQFESAAKLQPSDTVSRQLADLARSTATSDNKESAAEAEPAIEAPDAVPLEKLTGTWISDKGGEGKITLRLMDDGKFTWNFIQSGKTMQFGGEYSMNDDGLLVLDGEDSQMVASVGLPRSNEMKFTLAGGPPNDPGLVFTKSD